MQLYLYCTLVPEVSGARGPQDATFEMESCRRCVYAATYAAPGVGVGVVHVDDEQAGEAAN